MSLFRCLLASSLLLVAAMGSPAHAQPRLSADRSPAFAAPSEPVEWGEVPVDLLRATAFSPDSNAAALIVSDFGDARFRFNGEVEVKHHQRIKILTEAGYAKGTVTIPYYVEDRTQRVVDVEGVTYTLGSDGEVVEHELDTDDVFTEEISDKWEQIRFTLPNLEPGAVIEYRYKLRSKNFFRIPSWSFQHDEPTLYSAYEVTIPTFLEFVFLTRGHQSFARVEEDYVTSASFSGKSLEKRWVMTDVPAIREEPFITTPEDYRSRIQLQISRFRNPTTGAVEKDYLGTWAEAAEMLMDHDEFGEDVGKDRDVRRQVESITDGLSTDEEKIEAIYEYVRTSMAWNGSRGWLLNQDLDDAFAAKQGGAPEINLLLVSMLVHAGIDAHPALTSTRDHGKLTTTYPILEQFNYVLAAVRPAGADPSDPASIRLLDATSRHLPSSLLPVRALNQNAWVVSAERPEWVAVQPQAFDERSVFARLAVAGDGSISGTATFSDDGYAAARNRATLTDTGDEAFAATLLSALQEVDVSGVEVENRDAPDAPLKTSVDLSVPAYAQTAGDMMYLSPTLVPRFSENPFKQSTRSFPIDFAYPLRTTYTMSMQIPEGYAVQEMPNNQRVALPQNAGSFTQLAQVAGSTVTFRSVLSINAPVLPDSFYPALRTLLDRVVSAQSQPIVLKKVADAGDS
jgi:hypothetical protein